MQEIPLQKFVERVLTSRERVQFTHIDPFGHLNASRYLEFFLNHRIHAAEEQLACYTMDIVKNYSVAFVVQETRIRYLNPAIQGEWLEIGSWVSNHDDSGFRMTAVMVSENGRKAKAVCQVEFRSVDTRTGKSVTMPPVLPSQSSEDLISGRPEKLSYLEKVRGFPESFL